jgi:amidase
MNTARLIAVLAGASLLFGGGIVEEGRAQGPARSFELLEATIPELQAALAAGSVTSRDLVGMYLARVDAYDQRGPVLNAIAINGSALAEADALDAERRAKGPRGPLHGIPLIIKDNYEAQLIKLAYAYEQATRHRRPPASTPALGRR